MHLYFLSKEAIASMAATQLGCEVQEVLSVIDAESATGVLLKLSGPPAPAELRTELERTSHLLGEK